MPPLLQASLHGHAQIFQLLLENVANPNVQMSLSSDQGQNSNCGLKFFEILEIEP